MIVPNPCDPDYRVVKQAETLAKGGYEVRVFCTKPSGSSLPEYERINGVEYVRKNWTFWTAIVAVLGSAFSLRRTG